MTLPSSGAISINSLVGEYGGSAPHSLSEYYKGGGLVGNHANNPNVPTSGTISLSNFYGASNTPPADNNYSINGVSGTRGVILGSGVNYGWAVSASGGYGGTAYGANGSANDTSAQFGNNTTKRMLTGAVGYSATDSKGNTSYGIELFFGTTHANNLTSGTTGFSPTTASGMFSELSGNKLKVGGTQYCVFPGSAGNGVSEIVAGSTAVASAEMNGYNSNKIAISSSHSSTGSTTIGSNVTSSFSGNNITIQITT